MHAPGIYVEAEHEEKAYVYTDGNLSPAVYDAKDFSADGKLYDYTGVKALCRDFVDCCRSRKQPKSCFNETLKTMEVAEIILAQALLREKGCCKISRGRYCKIYNAP